MQGGLYGEGVSPWGVGGLGGGGLCVGYGEGIGYGIWGGITHQRWEKAAVGWGGGCARCGGVPPSLTPPQHAPPPPRSPMSGRCTRSAAGISSPPVTASASSMRISWGDPPRDPPGTPQHPQLPPLSALSARGGPLDSAVNKPWRVSLPPAFFLPPTPHQTPPPPPSQRFRGSSGFFLGVQIITNVSKRREMLGGMRYSPPHGCWSGWGGPSSASLPSPPRLVGAPPLSPWGSPPFWGGVTPGRRGCCKRWPRRWGASPGPGCWGGTTWGGGVRVRWGCSPGPPPGPPPVCTCVS